MEYWPFEDRRNVAVITHRRIMDGSDWIAFVSHDADDGGWQFHTNEPGPPNVADAVVIALSEIVQRDESILELADLPLGWRAWRESATSPWRRAKSA
jgi:hypothetical protein